MGATHDSAQFQLIQDQLRLLVIIKHTLILGAELFRISVSAYRMLQNSGAISLPNERLISNLLIRTTDDYNLSLPLKELKPYQRLVNIFLYKVNL